MEAYELRDTRAFTYTYVVPIGHIIVERKCDFKTLFFISIL